MSGVRFTDNTAKVIAKMDRAATFALKSTAAYISGEVKKSMKGGGGKTGIGMTTVDFATGKTKTGKRKNVPSPPGTPPNVQSGTLRGSIDWDLRKPGLSGRAAIGSAGVVYARIQEEGGRAGRNHAVVLPARPYLKPAIDKHSQEVGRRFKDAFRKMMR